MLGLRCLAGSRCLIRFSHAGICPVRATETTTTACLTARAVFTTSSEPATRVAKKKRRLDDICREHYPQHSRNLLQSWIIQGKVTVNGTVVTKTGYAVGPDAKVVIDAEEPKFVCRAGYKLEAALDAFSIDVSGMVALDSGLSTGGFADCLLQRGATKVYGVDVGHGQVSEKLKDDERLVVMEKTNLRYLQPEDLPCKVDIATLDLSFISVLKVIPAVSGVLKPQGRLVVLIKPQYEAGKAQVKAGGVVKDEQVHREVVARITAGIQNLGFIPQGYIESPLKGDKSGNTEFLASFVRNNNESSSSSGNQRGISGSSGETHNKDPG